MNYEGDSEYLFTLGSTDSFHLPSNADYAFSAPKRHFNVLGRLFVVSKQ